MTVLTVEGMAKARFVRVTPMKARRVVDLIRGKQANEAVATLKFAPQAAAEPVRKVVESALANARVKSDRASERFDEDAMYIVEAFVDEGPTLKRFRPRAQGRAGRILKRSSHITVVVAPVAPRAAHGDATAKSAKTSNKKEGAR